MTARNSTGASPEIGQALLELARQSITQQLVPEQARPLAAKTQEILKDPFVQKKRGTFVTLHKQGALRGCIGCLTAQEPIVENVRENAVNAAFRDPRFKPLTPEELPQIRLEVSILSEPKPLASSEPGELLDSLQRTKPGVILKSGFNQATFLPQVWKQLPRAEEFLGQLCLKAGLPQEAWKEGKVEILTYGVEYFEEA